MAKQYYITTPIYYVNSAPHVATAFTTIVADACARFRKALGEEVFFLTGTDENAPKVAEAAKQAGQAPQAFVDAMAEEFEQVFRQMRVEYDRFIRTTQPDHRRTVQKVFQTLLAKGELYKGLYEGWYCLSDETFFPASKVGEDRLCPNPECQKPLQWRQEESYFFRLSRYADRLRDHILSHPDFIEPETRRNETLGFLAEGLQDGAVTRRDTEWGIPVPDEPGSVVYVWFDALLNYLTATGWVEGGEAYLQIWPPDLQVMGKDILPRFHATLWPAMLMALDLPLPKKLFGHGWWIIGGEKISKSRGNVLHPVELVKRFSEQSGCEYALTVDVLRYYLLREMPVSQDANFSLEGMEARYNGDLANDLGNLVHRTLSMVNRYLGGTVPAASVEGRIGELILRKVAEVERAYTECYFPDGLRAAWEIITAINQFYDEQAPWAQAKVGHQEAVGRILYTGLETVRVLAQLVSPIMPTTTEEIRRQLHLPSFGRWRDATQLNLLPTGHRVGEPTPLFPRLEDKEGKSKGEKKEKQTAEVQTGGRTMAEYITIDDFKKLQMRIARVTEAEPVPGTSKLLQLRVTLGDEERTIVAGIAETYSPQSLIGKQIVLLVNLQPATIRGVVSEGMLLAADVNGKAILLIPDQEVPEGTPVR